MKKTIYLLRTLTSSHRKRTSHSVRFRVLLPISFLLLIQVICVIIGVYISGLLEHLDEKSLSALNHTLQARVNYLQYDMLNRWCNVESTVAQLNELYEQATADGVSPENFMSDNQLHETYLSNSTPSLINLMRKNTVTGAYIILRTGELDYASDAEEILPGVYLRDQDPLGSYTNKNNDLLIERAPLSVTSAIGISTDSTWKPMFYMNPDNEEQTFFYNSYRAALAYGGLSYSDLSYWSKPYILDGDSYSAISYSVPLIANDGTLYGVLGVEILTDYLMRQIPSEEIDQNGAYMLCLQYDNGPLTPIVTNATNYFYMESSDQEFRLERDEKKDYYHITSGSLRGYAACTGSFSLYNSNAPYSDEKWLLLAVESPDTLFAISAQTASTLFVILCITMLTSIIAAFIITLQFSRPVSRLEQEVMSGAQRSRPVTLPHTGIRELDSLARAIESLNEEIIRTEGKLSQILAMSSINLGAFELNTRKHTLFTTDHFFHVFGYKELSTREMSYDDFTQLLHSFFTYAVPDTELVNDNGWNEIIYEFPGEESILWVRLRTITQNGIITGFVEDITREWNELRRLEFERDHDVLTGLFNRRAFHEKYSALLKKGKPFLNFAALIMLDLDNLKYVNDTYGHKYGDDYIYNASQMILEGIPANALAARISGDEFYIFFYGYSQKSDLLKAIKRLEHQMHQGSIELPDGRKHHVRASAGIAWYPQDSSDPQELIRYADFAMYKGKHSIKGSFINFDINSYKQESYLLEGKEALNQLIEQCLVTYHFQPIISALTGEVFAYEALMRPQIQSLSTPQEVLMLARQESKLGAIEEITFFTAMDAFVKHCQNGFIPHGCRIFINSIANQCLSQSAYTRFESQFGPWLCFIVEEHTEEEQSNLELLDLKKKILNSWGGRLALDDYGSGYNGGNILLASAPDYIKIDIGMVQEIDTHSDKQHLASSLIHYAHLHNIGVIAEGVETAEEMKTLLSLGVDYIQGYLVAKPAFIPPVPSKKSLHIIAESRNPLE